jgi:hypothetical protein
MQPGQGRGSHGRGEKLLKSLAGLMVDRFHGSVTIRFESGKVTHVGAASKRMWAYKSLPTGSGELTKLQGAG